MKRLTYVPRVTDNYVLHPYGASDPRCLDVSVFDDGYIIVRGLREHYTEAEFRSIVESGWPHARLARLVGVGKRNWVADLQHIGGPDDDTEPDDKDTRPIPDDRAPNGVLCGARL